MLLAVCVFFVNRKSSGIFTIRYTCVEMAISKSSRSLLRRTEPKYRFSFSRSAFFDIVPAALDLIHKVELFIINPVFGVALHPLEMVVKHPERLDLFLYMLLPDRF